MVLKRRMLRTRTIVMAARCMNLTLNSFDRSRSGKIAAFQMDHTRRPIFRIPGSRRRILILGVGSLAQGLSQVLLSRSKMFTDIVGLLARENSQVGEDVAGTKVLGTMDQLVTVVERDRVDTIAVCLEDRRAVLPVQTLLDLKGLGVDIWDGHRLYEEESGRLPIDDLKPSSIIFSREFKRGIVVSTVKRT